MSLHFLFWESAQCFKKLWWANQSDTLQTKEKHWLCTHNYLTQRRELVSSSPSLVLSKVQIFHSQINHAILSWCQFRTGPSTVTPAFSIKVRLASSSCPFFAHSFLMFIVREPSHLLLLHFSFWYLLLLGGERAT